MNEKLLTPFVLNYPFLQDKSVVEMNIILAEAIFSAQLQQQEPGWAKSCPPPPPVGDGLKCPEGQQCWQSTNGGVAIEKCCKGDPNKNLCEGGTIPRIPPEWVEIYSESQMFQGGGGQGGFIQPVTICDSLGRQEINAWKKYKESVIAENKDFGLQCALLLLHHQECMDGQDPKHPCTGFPILTYPHPTTKELIVYCLGGCENYKCCLDAKQEARIISEIHRLEIAEIERVLQAELARIAKLRLRYCTDGGRLGETDAPPFEPPPAP